MTEWTNGIRRTLTSIRLWLSALLSALLRTSTETSSDPEEETYSDESGDEPNTETDKVKVFFVLELKTEYGSATATTYGGWVDELSAHRYKQELEQKYKAEYGKTASWRVMSHSVIDYDEEKVVEKAAEMAGVIDEMIKEDRVGKG